MAGHTMSRHAGILQIVPGKLEEYVALHRAVWPEVLAIIHTANIRNYSIYLRKLPDGNHYLFSYFEYVGADFAADMAWLAAEPKTQEWWTHCIPCQNPLPDRAEGEWWASLEEVFHTD